MIRLAEQNDAAQIAAIYRPYCENSGVTFETTAPDASEFTDRIARTRRQFPWLVDERDALITGYAYASPHRQRSAYRWVVEVTIYVQEGFRGKGVGRGLYQELFRRLRQQGYFKAYAGIVIPNPPSQAFHEALGFRQVATYRQVGYKLGAWLDTGWWQYDLQPVVDNPPEPRPPSGNPPRAT
jgi:L-amino acid N-acyltransferase YncA